MAATTSLFIENARRPGGGAEGPPVREEGLYVSTRGGAVMTREHVKPENEETYFSRTKGLL